MSSMRSFRSVSFNGDRSESPVVRDGETPSNNGTTESGKIARAKSYQGSRGSAASTGGDKGVKDKNRPLSNLNFIGYFRSLVKQRKNLSAVDIDSREGLGPGPEPVMNQPPPSTGNQSANNLAPSVRLYLPSVRCALIQ